MFALDGDDAGVVPFFGKRSRLYEDTDVVGNGVSYEHVDDGCVLTPLPLAGSQDFILPSIIRQAGEPSDCLMKVYPRSMRCSPNLMQVTYLTTTWWVMHSATITVFL